MNTGKRISLKRIIGNVVNKLDEYDVSSKISSMASWAVEAELKIGSRDSYEKFECEVEIKNFRACLPDNLVTLLAVKKGNDHLDVTMKDFTHFHKGTSSIRVDPDERFVAGNKVRPASPGIPNVHQIDFVPVFSPGDVINVTIANDNCGDVTTNVFTYIVGPADTLTDIINQFLTQINSLPGLPYYAVPDSTWFQVIAKTPLINLTITTYTDSSNGSISNRLIQARVLPTEETTITDDDCKVNINQGSNNLANRTTYNLNDNIHAEHSDASGYHFDNDFNYGVSKYSISNGHIHFSSLEKGKVGIAYYGIAVDDEGWPLIAEVNEDAVTHYLMWQGLYAGFVRGKISQGVFQHFENRWYWLCGQARGDSEMPTEDELQYLANAWNQLLPLPNKNFF